MSLAEFAADFAAVDISRPWLLPYAPMHRAFGAQSPPCADRSDRSLADWLNGFFADRRVDLATDDKRLCFAPQSALPEGVAYEKFIKDRGQIPTRDNLHDWFGACVWGAFPKSKARLNFFHTQNADDDLRGQKRGRVRDAITVFDENGALLIATNDAVGQGIKAGLFAFDWQTALVDGRPFWVDPATGKAQNPDAKAQVFVFGHGLLEQLVAPRKNLCAHTLAISVDADFFAFSENDKIAYADDALAATLDDWLGKGDATPQDLQPFPILGAPYFWGDQDAAFYADERVFRKGRRAKNAPKKP